MWNFEQYVVRGHSMTPTFFEGDRLLVSRFRGRSFSFARGELVVVRDGPDDERWHLKRLVGLPREIVRQSEGIILINDEPLDEDYLGGLPAVIGLEDVAWNLGDNEYFLLGDNRAHSTDSRQRGPFGLDDIEGKVRFRYWPLHKLRLFNAPTYRSLSFTRIVYGLRPED
ncbi:MAG: signal peptidase I [Dehalococcoidia bacterium]|nr:signal peptidase I [Dehalococcoidia bacterium]